MVKVGKNTVVHVYSIGGIPVVFPARAIKLFAWIRWDGTEWVSEHSTSYLETLAEKYFNGSYNQTRRKA